MAYELIFKYYEKIGACEYDKSKELSIKKTIGSLEVEISMEKLASAVFSQMARRDILVFDVEIFEFTKKKLSFKETKNGIIIKNKKFNLGLDNIIVSDEIEVPKLENNCCVETKKIQPQVQESNQVINIETTVQNNQSMIGDRKPRRKVIFSPTDLKYLKGKPWRFTPDKEYFVYRERMSDNGIGLTYLMLDDKNREFEVSDEFFIPTTAHLIGEGEPQSNSNNDRLSWQGANNNDVPKLR